MLARLYKPNFFSLIFYPPNDGIIFEETLHDLWENCILLSIESIAPVITSLIVVNIAFCLIASIGVFPPIFLHILTGGCGIYLLNTLASNHGKYIVWLLFALSYIILRSGVIIEETYMHSTKTVHVSTSYDQPNFTKCFVIVSLVICEYYLFKGETWLQVRGIIMICAMKLISLIDDIEHNDQRMPSIFEYFGYTFCCANLLFGPWVSFADYDAFITKPPKKSLWWIFGILRSLLLSIIFLSISNCWTNFYIKDNANMWILAYKEALAFRTSHYFISFLSESGMLAAGFKNTKIWNDENKWHYTVVNPSIIECPTALAIVVTNWNRPMHEFLKKYFYRAFISYGKFLAVLSTFVVSSVLHGFEKKVSVVLVTIGILSYFQLMVRENLSRALNACLKVHPCKECNHKYKRNSPYCIIAIIIFSMFTVFHLAFLGVLMDPSTDEIGIYEKWRNLYFASIWILVVNIIYTC